MRATPAEQTLEPNEPRVLAVRYTADPIAWHGILSAMGAGGPSEEGIWAPYGLASGMVVVHRVEPGDPRRGSTLVCLAVPDPAAYLGSLDDEVRRLLSTVQTGAGPLARVTADDGVFVDLLPAVPTPRADPGSPAVQAIWYSDQCPGTARALTGLGLRQTLRSRSGGWFDLRAPGGGSIGVHGSADPHTELAFEHPDIAALADRLIAAGIEVAVIDESYARTLRIPDPDGGPEIWVNEVITDLYGFVR